MKIFIIFLIFISLGASLHAAEIFGRVTDTLGEPLAFANIYVKGTTTGTSTNVEGYYHLELPAGTHQVIFQYLGYKVKTLDIRLSSEEKKRQDVILEERFLGLQEVVISDGEDPAYRVIRAAIASRKEHLKAIPSYNNEIYSKAIIKMRGVPGVDSAELDTMFNERNMFYQGILYFSESVSTGICKQGQACRKIVHSSRVSGESGGLSLNFIFEDPFNFYENNVEIRQLTQRGIISPVAATALFFYDYRLEEAYIENDLLINKIEVIPKRPNDPVFHGYIHIVEDDWRIYSTDLTITGKNGIRLLDTVRIRQTYLPVNDSLWMVFNQNFYFSFNLFGFSAAGNFLGVYSDYQISAVNDESSSREILKVEPGASAKDSVYWKEIRPVPLSEEELLDYRIKDSIETVHESKEYKDSVDRERNKLTIGEIFLSGYTYSNSYKENSHYIAPLLYSVNFNTVEGLNINLSYRFTQNYETSVPLKLNFFTRYGFSNGHLNGGGEYQKGMWRFAAGRDVKQFDENGPVLPLINTFSSLLHKENLMKIFEKAYAEAEWKEEIWNGITPQLEVSYAHRNQLFNTTGFSFNKDENKLYADNIPDYPEPVKTGDSRIFKIETGLQIAIAPYYVTIGDKKLSLGSKWPVLQLKYEKAIPGIAGSHADFDFIELGISDEMDLKLLGTSSFDVRAGKFMNRKNMYFQDYRHFFGNEIGLSLGGLNEFLLLPYYEYSTDEEFLEAHWEHNFEGFFFNKIPLIRKLKWQLVAGGKTLLTAEQKPYYELVFGIDNLINFKGVSLIRLDFVLNFRHLSKPGFGYILRMGKSFQPNNGGGISIQL
ncbi:MAG: DUF5686 and carboxypeptidase regulatory-like domain-containing protein [Bacteroidia bacterium]